MLPEISIVIPAYEESERIGNTLHRIVDYISVQSKVFELIVVDDGSGDDTTAVAEKILSGQANCSYKVIRYESNRGKGYAVRTGLEAARGRIALFTDADLSTPIEELPKLTDPISAGNFDITFGSRALDRSLIGTHQPWRREQGGKVFNLVVRLMTGMPYWDTQCGFKAFDLLKFRPLLNLMKIDRFGFDVEFLFVARLNGLRLKEIPVRWNNDERSKVNVFRDSIRMFNEVREIRSNARKGLYSAANSMAAAG